MVLCDTNVLIEFYKNNPHITAALRQIGLRNLAVSVITVAELYYGALNKAELARIKGNLALVHQIPVSRDVSLQFLDLMAHYALSHRPGIAPVECREFVLFDRPQTRKPTVYEQHSLAKTAVRPGRFQRSRRAGGCGMALATFRL